MSASSQPGEPNRKRLAWTAERRALQGTRMAQAWANQQQREKRRNASSVATKKAWKLRNGSRLTLQELATLTQVPLRTLYDWWRDCRIPPAPPDGQFSREYISKIVAYRKHATSSVAKSIAAKKAWTPERRRQHSTKMSDFYADAQHVERQRSRSKQMWANLPEEKRQQRLAKSISHDRTTEGRKKISEKTRVALSDSGVRGRISLGLRKAWEKRKAELDALRAGRNAPKKLGRPKGKTDQGTDTRIIVIGYCLAQGMSNYQVSTYWKRVTGQSYAKTTIDSFIADHDTEIDLRKSFLSALPESERDALSGLSAARCTEIKAMAAERIKKYGRQNS